MTEQQIQTGNRLIAQFMGAKFRNAPEGHLEEDELIFPEGKSPYDFLNQVRISSLKYHSSWDWIMPVVEKIAAIEITPPPNYTWYRIEMVPNGYVKIEGGSLGKLFTNVSREGSFINAVWRAVVDFIKHHNSLKHNK